MRKVIIAVNNIKLDIEPLQLFWSTFIDNPSLEYDVKFEATDSFVKFATDKNAEGHESTVLAVCLNSIENNRVVTVALRCIQQIVSQSYTSLDEVKDFLQKANLVEKIIHNLLAINEHAIKLPEDSLTDIEGISYLEHIKLRLDTIAFLLKTFEMTFTSEHIKLLWKVCVDKCCNQVVTDSFFSWLKDNFVCSIILSDSRVYYLRMIL